MKSDFTYRATPYRTYIHYNNDIFNFFTGVSNVNKIF